MIIADYGAEVIRLEPPGGDPMWEHPAYLLWQRGKKSVELDWESDIGRAQARRLMEGADIIVETLKTGEADRLGISYDAVCESNPALIYYSLSSFGRSGPYKDFKLSDGIVNAKSGRMRDQIGWQENRPTFRAINDISYHSAMFAVQAICAALRVRSETSLGQKLEGTLLSGVTAPNNKWRLFEGQAIPESLYPNQLSKEDVARGVLTADRHETDPESANPSQICPKTKDNRWIMHAHIQQELFDAWIDAIGFSWIRDDARFKTAPFIENDADRVTLNRMIFERFEEKTAEEWRGIYRLNPDCAGETMQTTQEALHHEQFRANGHIVEIQDPRVGRVEQVGPFANLEATPAQIDTPAPYPGQHTTEVLAELPRAAPRIVAHGGDPKRPLEGITVLECASWLAAPFAGALLADLGATVIKVEPLSGDPFRRMPTNENMIRAFQGKENIALNLKDDEGLRIFYELVKKADIVMHNYRPGVPERLKIDYETLSGIKPDLIYVYAASYGSAGPDRLRAAFNPTMGAFSGNSVFQSGEGNLPKGDQSPDPIAGSGVATGMMLGLAARVLTGRGQYIETSMMNSNVYCNSDDGFDYVDKPDRQVPDKAQLGLEATYRLYEASEGWIFLDARFDEDFAALAKALDCEEFLADARFASWPLRYQNCEELSARLGEIFRLRTADEWESLMLLEQVACVRADRCSHIQFLHTDAHIREVGFMVRAESEEFIDFAPGGRYWRHAPVVRFGRTPCEACKSYEGPATHTRRVLTQLGYGNEQIDRLAERRILAVTEKNRGDTVNAQR